MVKCNVNRFNSKGVKSRRIKLLDADDIKLEPIPTNDQKLRVLLRSGGDLWSKG